MRLLIVDDDASMRETLATLFSDTDYTLAEARNGEEALHEVCSHTEPCIVLLDNRMPRLDGAGLMRVIRSDPDLSKRIEIIFMTASQDRISVPAQDVLADLEASSLPKPFELDEMEAAVQHAAEKLLAA